MADEEPRDVRWMRRALACARRGAEAGETPVGAVVVLDGYCLGSAWNQPRGTCDPSAHAELLALRSAARRLGNYRLPESTLYVTLEPCLMCIGAILQARVARVVFGAFDPRAGAAGSVYDPFSDAGPARRPVLRGGVLEDSCALLLRDFFRERR